MKLTNRSLVLRDTIVTMLRNAEVKVVYPWITTVADGTKLIPAEVDIDARLYPENDKQMTDISKKVGVNTGGAVYVTRPGRRYNSPMASTYNKAVDTFSILTFSAIQNSNEANDIEILNQSIIDILAHYGNGNYKFISESVVPVVANKGPYIGQVMTEKNAMYPMGVESTQIIT